MKYLILFAANSVFAVNILTAQSRAVIYLGDDMNNHYATGNTNMETENDFTHRHFSGYDVFIHRHKNREANGKMTRSGIILPGENTTTYSATGEIVTGNGTDSVMISYLEEKQVVHHGRSATISVLNAFSKKQDKSKQRPYDEIRNGFIEGKLRCGEEVFPFNDHWLLQDADTIKVTSADQKKKTKTGKIKKAQFFEGIRLMKGETCLAAIDYFDKPQKYYLAKELSDREKLIIVSYLQIRELSMTLDTQNRY